jgi:rod shape-determining protein MreC
MESFFSRYKNPLILAMLLIAQFVLLAVQVHPRLPGAAAADQAGVKVLRKSVTTLVTPPEKAAHSGGLGIRGLWSRYVDLVDLKQQNARLEAENQRLQLEQAALSEDARQGERLQELLAFKRHYIDTTVPAQIVGTSGSDHGRVVYLDKGQDDGIQPDMPVITPDGIVGRIRNVTGSTAQVLEISDPTSAVGVVQVETRTRGIVRGNGAGQPEIVDMMPDSRMQPGQQVITSGGDQIFPRGLPVGTVARIVPDVDNPPLVNVILKPAANLGRLEEVMVVTSTGDLPSATARGDLARSERTAAALKATAATQALSAAEAALETQSAADVLAARLPTAQGVIDPDAPDAAPGTGPASANESGPPLHPPSALHQDHYSPGDTPSAEQLTPGERAAPYLQGKIPTVHAATPGQGDTLQQPGVSAAFRAAHEAAVAAGRPAGSVKSPTAASPRPAQAGTHPLAPAGYTGAEPNAERTSRATEGTSAKANDFGVVGEPRSPAATVVHHPGTIPGQPSVDRGAPKPQAAKTAGKPTVKAPVKPEVKMQIITDGPVTGSGSNIPARQVKPKTEPSHKPALVPGDGSRPPSGAPQERP